MANNRIRFPVVFTTAAAISLLFVSPLKSPQPTKSDPWTVEDSKAYANDQVLAWANKQMSCLNKLWSKESAWNPNAYNKIKVMGKNAGGIPQLLGLDPSTPPTQQIDRGLSYIYYRYTTPCLAWAHFQKKGWH